MRETVPGLRVSLLLLRLSSALVMAFWALDKFHNPAHGAKVFSYFYGLNDVPLTVIHAAGGAQMVLTIVFALGLLRFWSYGLMLLLHLATTVVSWRQYLEPFDNLLFLAAFPMLAALVAVFVLRERDTLFSLDALFFRKR
jgi:hypothetical protein